MSEFILKLRQQFHTIFDKRTLFFYCFAGGLSALVYFSGFALLWQWLHIQYKISLSVAYLFSVITHFTTNQRLTFQSKKVDLRDQLPRYLVMVFINYLITLCIVHVVVALLHLSPYVGILGAISITVVSGYLMAKFWVFKKVTKAV